MPSPATKSDRLRVAAINFLNPAPLLWNFDFEPAASALRLRYDVRYTLPSRCAAQLASGEADLGLVPIAALPSLPDVLAVPGCTIASLHAVRSIQLVLKPGVTLENLRTVAADAASRSSAAYVRVLLKAFHGNEPHLQTAPADLRVMLQAHDAALLIGDPALFALEARDSQGHFVECTWIDVASLWRQHTGLPWVAAVWAVRQEALGSRGLSTGQLTTDLVGSRDEGLQHIGELVHRWAPRLSLPEQTVRTYLTENIHYILDDECLRSIQHFFRMAQSTGVLPHYRWRML